MSIKRLKYKIYNIWFGEKKTLTVQFQVSLYAKILFEVKRVLIFDSTIFKLMDLCIFTLLYTLLGKLGSQLPKLVQGESKKSVICGAWCCTFFVQLSCMGCFQYFLKICNFFWYSNGPKENLRIFFLSKSKVQKSKNVHSYHFFLNIKFY